MEVTVSMFRKGTISYPDLTAVHTVDQEYEADPNKDHADIARKLIGEYLSDDEKLTDEEPKEIALEAETEC